MTRTSKYTTWGLLATLAATIASPVLADPGSQQKNKNNWRNLGIAGAAIAGYGLLKGDKTATILGAAGGAYSANRYETDRRHQSQDNNGYGYRRYHRNDNNSNNGGGYYDNNGSYNNNGNYNGGQWRNGSNGGYNDGSQYGNNGGQWRNDSNGGNQYNNGDGDDNSYARHDNGRHLGWTKHQGRGHKGDDKD